mmetsp:Transcript_4836/g.13989  ORF Transcript_4836/g.13989 Transcript_4836/m.13989 type:complete len:296 (-) Transcript_4836:35-922(-)
MMIHSIDLTSQNASVSVPLREGFRRHVVEGTSIVYHTYGLDDDGPNPTGRTPCLCVPEVGLSAVTCFHTLIVASPPDALLKKTYYMILVDDLDEATVAAVVGHRGLKEVLGLAVGNGGHLLCKMARSLPLIGMVLISPSSKRASWFEYGTGSLAALRLSRSGWTRPGLNHFAARLFSPGTRQYMGGDSSLLKALREDMRETDPRKVHREYKAVLSRGCVLEGVRERVKCRVLLIVGAQSIYYGESMELAQSLDKARLSVFEVEQAGTWVNQERVGSMLGVIDRFLVGLQQDGYGL